MEEKTILEHLKDIKKITIRLLIYIILLSFLSFFFVEEIFKQITAIFQTQNAKLVYSTVYGGFSSRISVALNTALITFLPLFTLEALIYLKNSFKISFRIFLFSTVLYFVGVIATLYIVIPFFTKFLLSIGFFGIDFYIEAEKFINFTIKTLLAFAIMFQIPIIIALLLNAGIISKKSLKKQRKNVFVSSFILGAILTPPDVLSQVIGASLIYLLFELSILCCKEKHSR
jgi:sec-independent protein translocase protein TatC